VCWHGFRFITLEPGFDLGPAPKWVRRTPAGGGCWEVSGTTLATCQQRNTPAAAVDPPRTLPANASATPAEAGAQHFHLEPPQSLLLPAVKAARAALKGRLVSDPGYRRLRYAR
jgi:hypothetical protein